MRIIPAILSLSLVIGAPALPAHADVPALAPDLEACIRTNAAKVEAAEPDLNKAVDYLVLNVCAIPVANAREREAQRLEDEQTANNQAKCDKWKAEHPDKTDAADQDNNEEDGVANYSPCLSLDLSGWSAVYVTGYSIQGVKPPAAAALASQLILDLRLSHSKPGQTH